MVMVINGNLEQKKNKLYEDNKTIYKSDFLDRGELYFTHVHIQSFLNINISIQYGFT